MVLHRELFAAGVLRGGAAIQRGAVHRRKNPSHARSDAAGCRHSFLPVTPRATNVVGLLPSLSRARISRVELSETMCGLRDIAPLCLQVAIAVLLEATHEYISISTPLSALLCPREPHERSLPICGGA